MSAKIERIHHDKATLQLKENHLTVVEGGLLDQNSQQIDNKLSFEQFKKIQLCRQKFKEYVINLAIIEQKKCG